MTTNLNCSQRATGLSLAVLAALGTGLGLSPSAGWAAEITEIVVTSRRREERLQDVPLAITAFDTNTIEAAAISSMGDVADLTPGLSFFNAMGENLPVPVIRGVVPQDIFGVNATAIFVDGVYVSGREGLNFSQLDVERIEVVKGPQSAMYGRNAFAGAINYVTKAPSDEFEAKAETELGNRGKQRVMGQISGPILGETLTGRVSALYDEWDGSYDNTIAPENDIGGYRYRSLQGRLRWRPTDRLDINLGLYSSNDEIDEAAIGGLPVNCEDQVETTTEHATNEPFPRLQNWCGKIPKLAALPDRLDPAQFPNMVLLPNSITSDSMPKLAQALGEDRDLVRGNLNIAWDLDVGTLDFLTGYSDTEQNSISDFSRTSGDSLPLIYCPDANTVAAPPFCNAPFAYARAPMGWIDIENGATVEEWSQEIRFTSPQDKSLRYLTGAYYFHVDQKNYPGAQLATTQIPANMSDIGVGPIAYPTSLAIGSYIFGPSLTPDGGLDPLNRIASQDKTESWSVFGSVDFDFAERWTAGAELRYSQEAQKVISNGYAPCGNPDLFPFNDAPAAACGDDVYDLRVMEPCVRQYDATSGDYLDCLRGSDFGKERFQTITGRVSLKYTFDSGWMAYGSIARGDKPGGLQLIDTEVINSTAVARELVNNSWDQEKLTSYELGIKGYTSDRRIYLDFAIFHQDWTDIVLRQLTETSPASGLKFTQPTALNFNAGDAKVTGWEMTTNLNITDNLSGRLTAAWTDSRLTNARMDTFSLFPSFYTTEPSCAPAAIQGLPTGEQDAKAAECQLISGDVSGNTQMRTPEWTASGSLSYEHPLSINTLGGDWSWFARADANYLGKIYVGNDNEGWLPARTNANLRLGIRSPRYSLEFWVRNLFENDSPIAAFRDIYWTNDDDIQGLQNPANVRAASNFDDFPPLRMSVSYPSLRTYGLVAKMRFGGAEQ